MTDWCEANCIVFLLLLFFIVALAFVAVARSVANSMLLIYKSTPPQRPSLISTLLKIQKLISGNDVVETFHRKGGCIKATGVREKTGI
jgi:hypothetical protein